MPWRFLGLATAKAGTGGNTGSTYSLKPQPLHHSAMRDFKRWLLAAAAAAAAAISWPTAMASPP